MKSYEKYVSRCDIEKIHENSLRILKEVGVAFEHPEALEIFRKKGMRIDGDHVFFEEKHITEALATVPSEYTIRSFKGDTHVGGNSVVIRPAGSNIYISENGNIRRMHNEDNFKQFKLADTSDVITNNHINCLVDFEGFTHEQRKLAQMCLQLKYSNKPTTTLYPDFSQLSAEESPREEYRKAIQLVKKYEGIENDYVLMPMINALSPLTMDYMALERTFATVAENQPVWFIPCAMPLMTAPASVAGMAAQTNAEQLAAICLAQIIRPGIATMYGNTSCSTDMRTIQLAIGAPETCLMGYITAGLADYYNLPFRTGGGLSDAKDCDIQAGVEAMMVLKMSFESGSNWIEHSCGTIGSFNVVNFEKFLMDEEIIRINQRLCRGIDCSDEKMCFDLIKETGARGSFLKGRTPKMYREEFFMPKYLNKQDPKEWEARGNVPINEVLSESVRKRLDSWQAPSIEKDRLAVIEKFIPEQYRDMI